MRWNLSHAITELAWERQDEKKEVEKKSRDFSFPCQFRNGHGKDPSTATSQAMVNGVYNHGSSLLRALSTVAGRQRVAPG